MKPSPCPQLHGLKTRAHIPPLRGSFAAIDTADTCRYGRSAARPLKQAAVLRPRRLRGATGLFYFALTLSPEASVTMRGSMLSFRSSSNPVPRSTAR